MEGGFLWIGKSEKKKANNDGVFLSREEDEGTSLMGQTGGRPLRRPSDPVLVETTK